MRLEILVVVAKTTTKTMTPSKAESPHAECVDRPRKLFFVSTFSLSWNTLRGGFRSWEILYFTFMERGFEFPENSFHSFTFTCAAKNSYTVLSLYRVQRERPS